LLDVELKREICFSLPDRHNAIAYVISGRVLVNADGRGQMVASEHALALHGSGGGRVVFQPFQSARLVILSGPEIDEPVIAEGPFIMNQLSQIEAAFSRYRSGGMGRLEPLLEGD
jgi:redox-sensitive bicupin YhaK (pirin superfamily)